MTTVESEANARIDGTAAAALLAAGVGAFVLGLLTTLNEASEGVHDFLEFNTRVGPLSGKTIIAVIAYFAALVALGAIWRGRRLATKAVLVVTLVLLLLGLVGTFPTFFEAFAD
jgi:hypothetical protein